MFRSLKTGRNSKALESKLAAFSTSASKSPWSVGYDSELFKKRGGMHSESTIEFP